MEKFLSGLTSMASDLVTGTLKAFTLDVLTQGKELSKARGLAQISDPKLDKAGNPTGGPGNQIRHARRFGNATTADELNARVQHLQAFTGLPELQKQFPELWEFAAGIGKGSGKNAIEIFPEMLKGISSGDPGFLGNIPGMPLGTVENLRAIIQQRSEKTGDVRKASFDPILQVLRSNRGNMERNAQIMHGTSSGKIDQIGTNLGVFKETTGAKLLDSVPLTKNAIPPQQMATLMQTMPWMAPLGTFLSLFGANAQIPARDEVPEAAIPPVLEGAPKNRGNAPPKPGKPTKPNIGAGTRELGPVPMAPLGTRNPGTTINIGTINVSGRNAKDIAEQIAAELNKRMAAARIAFTSIETPAPT